MLVPRYFELRRIGVAPAKAWAIALRSVNT